MPELDEVLTIDAAALPDHDGDHVPAGKEHAFEIVVDLGVEAFLRHFGRAAGGRAADIIDQNIDAAEFVAAGLGHGADLRIVEDVADMGCDIAGRDLAVIADARHRLRHRIRGLVDGEDFRALAREQHGRGAAIAPAWPDATGPGNDRDFSLHPSRHRRPPLWWPDFSGAGTATPA